MSKKFIVFDWGDTIMRDFKLPGTMKDWEKVAWVPGAEEMLIKVCNDYLCCIATSASHSATSDMIAALKRVGAEKYFRYFVSSADLGYAKPDPEFFRQTVQLLEATADECISIGNLYEKDIVPAKACGLATIWFNETNKKGYFPDADFIINAWEALPGVLKLLEARPS